MTYDDQIQAVRGFAERLQAALDADPRSYSAVADAAGVKVQSLYWHRNAHTRNWPTKAPPKQGPTLSFALRLARALGVSPGWLAFGEGEP